MSQALTLVETTQHLYRGITRGLPGPRKADNDDWLARGMASPQESAGYDDNWPETDIIALVEDPSILNIEPLLDSARPTDPA